MPQYTNPEYPVPHMLIVSGFPVYQAYNKVFLDANQALELALYMSQATKITFAAPVNKEVVHPFEITLRKYTFKALPALYPQKFMDWLFALVYFPWLMIKLFRLMRITNHLHVVGPGYPALAAIFLMRFFPKKRKTYSYQKSWGWTPSTTFWDYLQQKLLLRMHAKNNITVLYYGRIFQAPKHMKLFFRSPIDLADPNFVVLDKTLDKKPFTIVFADPLEPEYHPLLVAQVAQQLFIYGTPVILNYYADGSLKEELEMLIKRMGAHEFIKVYPAQTPEQMMLIFRNTHLLITIPDEMVWPEMMVRAMREGCVPLHSRVGCAPDYLFYGERGLLADANLPDLVGSIEDLYHYPENYHRMTLAGAAWARDFYPGRLNRLIRRLTATHGIFTRHDLPIY